MLRFRQIRYSVSAGILSRAASKRDRGQEQARRRARGENYRDKRLRWQVATITLVSEIAYARQTEEATPAQEGWRTRLTPWQRHRGNIYIYIYIFSSLLVEINLAGNV